MKTTDLILNSIAQNFTENPGLRYNLEEVADYLYTVGVTDSMRIAEAIAAEALTDLINLDVIRLTGADDVEAPEATFQAV